MKKKNLETIISDTRLGINIEFKEGTVVNFLLKMLLCPGVIFIIDALSPAINYTSTWHIILTGVFIGIVGYMMDAMLLVNIGAEASTVIDTIAAAIVVYFSQFFAFGSSINFLGALSAGSLLGLSEYLTHRLILGDVHMEKRRNY